MGKCGSYVLVLVYQIYVISLFVRLRRSEKTAAMIKKETGKSIHDELLDIEKR